MSNKRVKRLSGGVTDPSFMATLNEDLDMIWRELDRRKPSTTSTTNVTNITQTGGGKRFVVTDITISDSSTTTIAHGLGLTPTTVIVVPRLNHKCVHRQWINTAKLTDVTVAHGLNLPTGTNSQWTTVTFNAENPTTKTYITFIGNASDPNTWTVQFDRDAVGIVTGWLTVRREPPTWWTTQPSDSTNVYLRASESFMATVIVEE